MTTQTRTAQQSALDQLRALVMADEGLASPLSQTDDPLRLAELAIGVAAAHGIALTAETIREQIRDDPLGLTRWTATPAIGSKWPPRHWLPFQVSALDGQLFVDWANFGPEPLTAPFFEDSIRRALRRPFNRMFRYRMRLDDFSDGLESAQALAPAGFIFHMSRCGSTLVSQMLAALPSSIAISEAAPIDAAVQLSRTGLDILADRQCELLRAMIAAFGRPRSGCERHYYIKLDSWHTLALPLFRRAFPKAPWVFLYREPTEVLVSQNRQRGTQMVPEIVPPGLYGFTDLTPIPNDEYNARVLARICQAAADHYALGGGLMVDYCELPEAVFTKILPHFGMTCSEQERAIMNRAARYDAKAPSLEYTSDSAVKQREAGGPLRVLAERHVGGVYRQLEDIRKLT